ncbi:MAG: hypothetical protein J2P45_21105, partial [Candidatus Dormibacteraeota bacterium]|nr:hypothetical protein [Candidatus Dormibacteraeota bacterium]
MNLGRPHGPGQEAGQEPSTDEPWALIAHAGEVPAERRAELARELREPADGLGDWALLETCHRVEAYGVGDPPPVTGGRDMRLLRGEAAISHLFRVACGMESAVVGEDEVLHQVRDALASSRDGGVDPRVARLFESAIAAGRAARSVPAPPRRSLAERAVAWLGERAGKGPLMVVGTGPMGSALARAAEAAGSKVVLASRTSERAHVDLAVAARLAPQCAAVAVALGGEWRELTDNSGPLPPIADLSSPSAVPLSVRSGLDGGFLGIDGLWERG